MELIATTFINEVDEIERSGPKSLNSLWEVQFLIGKDLVLPHKLLSIDFLERYAGAYAPETVIEVVFGLGTYMYRVLPYKSAIRATLFRTVKSETTLEANLDVGIRNETLRAIPISSMNEQITGNLTQMSDEDTGNQLGFVRVKFELQSIALEQLRMMTFGANFINEVPGNVLHGVITKFSRSINTEQQFSVPGVNMYPPHNTERRSNIMIPHNTPLMELADYLQKNEGGIYRTGLGFFLKRNMWYIWPLFDLTRFNSAEQTLTLLLIPPNQRPSSERTYRTTTRQVIVLITGGSEHADDTEAELYNQGNGIRFTDSRKVLGGFGQSKGNRSIMDRGANNTEFVGIKRPSGLNNLRTSANTDNIYHEASKLSSRAGARMMLVWQNSDPTLIKPNMPVKVSYIKDGIPVELNASLLEAHTYVQPAKAGYVSSAHVTSTVLTVFVEKDTPEIKEYLATNPTPDFAQGNPVN